MFLHVSVILFTGGGLVSQHALQVVSKHALQQVSREGYPSMPCRFPGPHPGGKLRGLARGVSRPTPGGLLPVGVPAPRGICSGGRGVETPNDGYCCRRYTFYWNAFLFCILFLVKFGTKFHANFHLKSERTSSFSLSNLVQNPMQALNLKVR